MSMLKKIQFVGIVALALSAPATAFAAYAEGGYYSQSYYQSYYQGYYQGTYQTTFTNNATENKDFTVFGSLSKGSGTFVIDHPLDPKNKLLFHSFVESPDVKNFYDGIATLDANGEAIITLPNYFMALNEEFRYQLKPIGKPQPDLYIKNEITSNRFTIAGGEPRARVSWQVTGIRHDPYILANPIIPEVRKSTTTGASPGEFLHADVYSSFPDFRSFFVLFEGMFGQ